MKKLFMLFGIIQLFWFPGLALAQSAKVVDVQGQVLVKNEASASWDTAKINMFLAKDAEIQTQSGSRCTLAFDEELKNILTVQENSHIKLDNIKPGNVFLSEGRVFSLIKNLPKTEKFQVRTPTAIAGARGTGWSTSFGNGKTGAHCFEDSIVTEGTNHSGEHSEKDVDSGYGVEIGEDGAISDAFPLDDTQKREWNGFINNIRVIVEGFRPPRGNQQTDNDPPGRQKEKPASRI